MAIVWPGLPHCYQMSTGGWVGLRRLYLSPDPDAYWTRRIRILSPQDERDSECQVQRHIWECLHFQDTVQQTVFTCPWWDVNRVATRAFFGERVLPTSGCWGPALWAYRHSDLRWRPGTTLLHYGSRYTW